MTQRILITAIALALVGAACGQSSDSGETTTTTVAAPAITTTATVGTTATTAPATTLPETTTTTIDPRPRNPLNGMPVDDETLIDRKVVAVKIDNHPNARPQSGLQFADAIIELQVEGGLTRFIALFLEGDAEWLGPMRSVRPTDSTVVAPLNGVIQMSGGQPWVQQLTLANDVAMIGEVGAPITMRSSQRNRPHNLYVDTFEIRPHVEARGLDPAPPDPIFTWGELNGSPVPHGTELFFDWTDNIDVIWQWNGSEYLRFTRNNPHNLQDSEGEVIGQIAADTLVVLKTEQYTACPSGAGSCVVASDTVGSNEALVFAGGSVVEGTWERDAITEWFTITTDDGAVMAVPPGRMWIMLYPDDAEITW